MAHVLLIDDDPQVQLLLRMVFEEAGHEVSEASNGRAGVQAYARRAAEVVVCDQFMPVLDGLETIPAVARPGPGGGGGRHDR